YIALPIDATGNAAAQDAESKQASRKKFDIRKIIVMIAFNEQAQQVARTMYHTLFFNPECQSQYAQFFREIITNNHGATLFHCSQGKDRTGVAAALLLAALGADRSTIVADFDTTNAVYADDVRKYSRRVRFFGGGDKEVAVVKAFIGVNTDNFIKALDRIDAEYGSIENYLKGPIGLTDDDIKVLRTRYLTNATAQ
ncbi:MAG: tyrosine-protein phosphatase, partial [Paludibacteraceae bacterium]|nr:tyrosine-protein phosphatase [Paludibacteraceae bacterium]